MARFIMHRGKTNHILTMKKSQYLTGILSIVCVIVVVAWATGMTRSHDIKISFAETKDGVTLKVSYPEGKSARVHDYIKGQFKGIDLPNLSDATIEHKSNSGEPIQFHLSSSDGNLKIVMSRKENSPERCRRLKIMGNEINKLLTD